MEKKKNQNLVLTDSTEKSYLKYNSELCLQVMGLLEY